MASGEGTAFGKYFLLKKIAAGGMGEIFLAKLKGPVGFEKLMVIKRILQHHVENQEFIDMFFAEARVAAQLNHSNIVQIFEMGEIDDAYFIAMEYVHGKSLRDIIDRAREMGEYIPPGLVAEIIGKLSDGLSYAHNARDLSGDPLSIIHRDINPHNLLVSYAGDVKIIDFGIAKSEMSMHKTETGTIKGKFVYMSPEQSAAEPLDKRSDIFPVGICLYEALTGQNPFAKANVVLSLDAIQRKDPPPVSEHNPRLAAFDSVIAKALAKNRDERYSDCSELRHDLQNLVEQGAIPKPPQDLADYMHNLFEEQIEREKRMILETDSANTTQLESMRAYRVQENSSASGRLKAHRRNITATDRVSARAATVEYIEDEGPHSRLPFVLLLIAIVAFTGVAAAAVLKIVRRSNGVSTVTPVATAPQATPPQSAPPRTSTKVAMATPPRTPTPSPPVDHGATAAPPSRHEGKRADRLHGRVERRHGGRLHHGTKASSTESSPERESVAPPPAPPPPPRPAMRVHPRSRPHPRPPPSPPPAPGFGAMQLSTNPPVRIMRNGHIVGQTIELKSSTGLLVFGTGKDPHRDPFVARVRYKVAGGKVTYVIDSTPWAIVRGRSGIGLGRTPLPPVKGGTNTVFDLINPKGARRLRIMLHYAQ